MHATGLTERTPALPRLGSESELANSSTRYRTFMVIRGNGIVRTPAIEMIYKSFNSRYSRRKKLIMFKTSIRLITNPKSLQHSKMPAFTLYGARGSTNTDRVRLTLAEGGFTDYELVLLNLQKGEQKVQ